MTIQLARMMTSILALVVVYFSFQVKCEELDDTIRINVWVKTAEITNPDLVKYIQENIVPEAIDNNYNQYVDLIEIYESSVSKHGTIFTITIYPSCYPVKNFILDNPDVYQVDFNDIYVYVRADAREQSWFKPLPIEKLFGKIKYEKGGLRPMCICDAGEIIIRLLSGPKGIRVLSLTRLDTEWFKNYEVEEIEEI